MIPLRYRNRPSFFLLSSLLTAIIWFYFSCQSIVLIGLLLIPYLIVGLDGIFRRIHRIIKKKKESQSYWTEPDKFLFLYPQNNYTDRNRKIHPAFSLLLWSLTTGLFSLLIYYQSSYIFKQNETYKIEKIHNTTSNRTIITATPKRKPLFYRSPQIYIPLTNKLSTIESIDYVNKEICLKELVLKPINIDNNSFNRFLLGEGYTHIINGRVPLDKLLLLSGKELSKQSQPLPNIFQKIKFKLIRYLTSLSSISNLDKNDISLLSALCFGYRDENFKSIRDDYANAGVAHVLAVSGFHLGVILSIITLLLKFILPYYRQRYLRSVIIFLGLSIYTIISGSAPSTLRAYIMALTFLFYKNIGRNIDPIQCWCLAVFILLVANPYYIFNSGFLLSISAVWGIIHFYPILKDIILPENKLLKYLMDMIWISIAAQIGILPWIFLFFHEWSLIFLWSNIPIVLLSIISITLGFITVTIIPLFPIWGKLLSGILHETFNIMNGIASFFSTIPDTSLYIKFDLISTIIYYIFTIGLYYFIASYKFKRTHISYI